jgi:HSP20 family protein
MNVVAQVPVKQAQPAPARPSIFSSLQREIDRIFEDFTPALTLGGEATSVRCKMDLAETKDGLELTCEVPGLEEKDIAVNIADGLLTVSGEKRFEREEKDTAYRFIERGYGSFSRSIELPPGVKAEDIKATLAKGVLKVMVPTPAKPEPQKVQVTSV